MSDESQLIRLCATDAVPDGHPLKVELPDRPPVAVYHIEGEFYVTDDTCTHGEASLTDDGELDGFNIECTFHFGIFDVRTGKVVARPCTIPLKTYAATVRDDAVWIGLDAD